MDKIEKRTGSKCFSNIANVKYWGEITLLFAVISFCYYISLKFIFPGYFDPLIPQNADFFYTYNGLSAISWMKIFTVPRPIGFFALKIVGILGMKGVIIFLISLTFINILLTINFVKKISNLKIYWPIVLVYLFLIFSHPGFYFNYIYDFFDAIAYFFVILATLIWLKKEEQLTTIRLVVLSILIGLSFFSKETYIVTLLIFWIWHFIFKKNKVRKNAVIMLLISTGILVAALIQSRISQSIWINFGSNADNPYFVNLNPHSIFETLYFYLSGWGNMGVFFIITLSLLIVLLNQKYFKEFWLLIFMGFSAYLPYSILPNHETGCYFWLGVPLSYAAILLVQPDTVNTFLIKIRNKKISAIIVAAFVVAFIALTLLSLKNNKDQRKAPLWEWSMGLEKNNRNIISSFPILKNNIKENDRILITGMNFGTHPFSCQHELMDIYLNRKNDFIDNYFGKNHKWTISEYGAGKSIKKSCNSINYINDDNIDLTSFEEIFVFGNNGKLIKIFNKDEVSALKDTQIGGSSFREAILNPELFK
jgi:hypothetical protein